MNDRASRPFRPRRSGSYAALLISAVLAFGADAGQAAQRQRLEKGYRDWLEKDVAYIITKEERDEFLGLTSDELHDKFIERFWEARNPTPGSSENTYREEIYRRIAYANANFGVGSGSEGWRTDRGHTYITLGPPQQKEVHRNAANLYPIEIWFYSFSHAALPPFFYIMFYQREGFGDFRFYSPYFDGPDKLVTGTFAVNDRRTAVKMIQDSLGAEVARLSLSLLPDEPVDSTNATSSLQSDVMLSTIRNLANNPFTKKELAQRRQLLESVTSRLVIADQSLDVTTLPVRDSRGLTRLDYALWFRNPSDFSVTRREDGKYYYSVEARVRVFAPDGALIFTQQKSLSDTIDEQRLTEIRNKRFGYEGFLPLPPGKYRMEFLLTDWQKKAALRADKEVVVPSVEGNSFQISGVLPFSTAEAVDPALADVTPFALAGVKFSPLAASSLILRPEDKLRLVYQIWTAPKDPRAYLGEKLEVEYALGRPAATGTTVVKEEVSKEQFDPVGSMVNGKQFPLDGEPSGNYRVTVTVAEPDAAGRASGALSFSVLNDLPVAGIWDVADPSIRDDLAKGISDEQRGLCLLAQGKTDEARAWFRRALDRNAANETARARLVDAYYAREDYVAVLSLYRDAGITNGTDTETILRIAESFSKSGDAREAISLLERAVNFRPESGPLYLALAGYYQQIGDSGKAAELTRKGKSRLATETGAK